MLYADMPFTDDTGLVLEASLVKTTSPIRQRTVKKRQVKVQDESKQRK
jgi:hypothetical protein